MNSYPLLSSKGKIGDLEIKNRLFMTAAGCELSSPQGEIGDDYIAYYEARTKGGVGAIITELMQVNPVTGVMNSHQVHLWEDSCIPGLKKLADRIHQYDCKIFVQIQHPGNVATPSGLNGKTPVSSSDVSNLIFSQPVRPMTIEEIHELVEQFGDAALRAKKAGIDGVEIHAAHFYLIHQFLSPYFNHRTDEYGGSHENRMRILKEIIDNIRKKAGTDYPVLVRVSAEEYLPEGGYHLDEGIEICKDLEQYGVSALDITVAGTGCRYGQSLEPISYRQGWRKHIPAAVKKFVKIPVIGVSVFRDPDYAEETLKKGCMDFIGSARNYIADPEWANKVFLAEKPPIRKCISCLKCIQGAVAGQGISCSVNPLCGRELLETKVCKDGNNRSVVVLGGGPAGMQAAVTAAQRGFAVTLFEKASYLGGQLNLASKAPNKEKIQWFVSYMMKQIEQLGIELHLDTAPDLHELKELNPYAIIDATGSTPIVPKKFERYDDFVLTPDMILGEKVHIEDQHVIIIGSGMTGLETAEYLASRGNMVTMIEMDDRIARQAYGTQVKDVTKYLELSDTVIMTSTALEEICDGYILIKDLKTEKISSLPADKVVLSMGVCPLKPYDNHLEGIASKLTVVGDACRSGRIIDAVQGGFDAALAL